MCRQTEIQARMRFHLLLRNGYEQYLLLFFERRANLRSIIHVFKFHRDIHLRRLSAVRCVQLYLISDDVSTETPSLLTHSTSDFFDDSVLRVTCAVESIRRSDDPRGRRYRQFERYTSSRRMEKNLTSNFAHDEGVRTTASDFLLDRFEYFVI